MDQIILRTPQMALRLAEILFRETQSPRKLEWFEPLKIEDAGDVWHVSGKLDPKADPTPGVFDDQFVDHTFEMYAAKANAEVKDILISTAPKLTPEIKDQIRQVLEAEGRAVSGHHRERVYSPGVWISEALHGGVINSTDAATRFGELVFDNFLSLVKDQTLILRAELVDGIWHVDGRTQDYSTEAVFRRSNAQVISLDLRPVE